MIKQIFDAIVIGSGQAGTPLVFRLANEGKKVAFIEKEYFGGTCVNNGCTPTKTYVASAKRIWDVKKAKDLGIIVPDGFKIDLKRVKARKDKIVSESVEGISKGVSDNDKIVYFKGKAAFTDFKTVAVNGETLTAEKIFINVGGRSHIPEGFEEVDYLTNKTILELEEVPEHLIILGGSYLGLEFGQMFSRFGSKVTIIEKNDRITPKEDQEVSEAIISFLKEEGIDFYLNSTRVNAQQNEKQITVNFNSDNQEKSIKGSHLLLAVGRDSNADTLSLDKTNVKTDKRNFITVNDYLETNIKGIYALGDCNGRGAFTHTSYNDYEIIVANMFDNGDRKVTDRIITYGLYIDPPLGRVGMTIKDAENKGLNFKVVKREMNKISRAKEKGETKGFISIIVDLDSNKILGATVLGVGGDEIISSLINVMYADVPFTVIRDSVHPHPTVSELIPTILEEI
ncbi:MAG: mercuric reductase [Brumimicrobium sp.]